MCRGSGNLSAEQSTEFAGHATALGLGEELNEWISLHKYSLTVIVHSVLRRSGGVESNCRQGRVVVFKFAATPRDTDPNPDHEDPSLAFRVRDCKAMSAKNARGVVSREGLEDAGPAGEPEETGFRGDPSNTVPAGFIQVLFAVEGTKIVLATRCAVYSACHHPDDAPVDEEMAAAFSDLEYVFVNFIHYGIVLRPPPADEREADPEAGSMVRRQKRWRWQREDYPWDIVDTTMALDRIPLRTALPAKTLWTRFQQW